MAGGAVLYALIAIGARSDRRLAAWAALLVPVLPLTIIARWLAGAPVPAAPDLPMLAVAAVQLVAAALAAVTLWRGTDRGGRSVGDPRG